MSFELLTYIVSELRNTGTNNSKVNRQNKTEKKHDMNYGHNS